MVERESIEKRLKGIKVLPTFFDVVNRIVSIIEDPMSSASDIARHMDPSIIGEVMRVANSAYFGTKGFRKISSIEHAIAVIGFDHLLHIVLQMPFLSWVKRGDAGFDRQRFIKHSIATSILSKTISMATKMGNPNQVYVSGILHDIGVIITYSHFKEEWLKIGLLVTKEGMSRIKAEEEVLGMDHGYLGSILLEMWNIPLEVSTSVRFHHYPERAEDNKENVIMTSIGNAFAKRIDLDKDMDNLSDFMVIHRGFIENISESVGGFFIGEEQAFFEKIYRLLKKVNDYSEGMG
jgi:putative nucleotidyltransferase with HDIG domain